MGCSTCSTTTGGSPGGCENNGTCGTSGCNKLNVYNWLSDMTLPDGQKPFHIVEVRFKGSRKEFFKNLNNIPLKAGDIVAVEGNPGHDIGTVSIAGELVRLQLKKKNIDENSTDIKTLYRIAKGYDLEKLEEVKALEVQTMYESRTIALELKLQMKLSDVEFQGDGKKATFYYTAEDRVDFRELIKRLADRFKTRVDMRQIGMRQEAARLGGIGSCGRELCCSTWLTDFKAVTTSAARYQNLSLNQIKLAGQCGKLKCCLNYELDSYIDAVKDFADTNIKLELQNGYAKHVKTDIFKRIMWYSFVPNERKEGFQFGSDAWIQLSIERVNEIIEMNKQGIKPGELKTDIEIAFKEISHDYENVVGQDSITRLDKKKKHKKKSGNKDRQNPSQNQNREQLSQGAPQATAAGSGDGTVTTPPANKPPQNQGQRPPQNKNQGQKPQQGQGQKPQNQGPRPQQNQGPKPEAVQQPKPQQNQGAKPQQQGQKPQQNTPREQRPPQPQQNKENRNPQQKAATDNKPQQPKPQQAENPKPAPPVQRAESAAPKPAAPGGRQRIAPPPEN